MAGPLWADSLRIATYNTELSRKGPGLLLQAIRKGDPQVAAVVEVIARAGPDVIALQGIDYDLDGAAIAALARRLEAEGLSLPYHFALHPNAGLRTGLDMDGDGRSGGPRDAQGYGLYRGHGGMAVLSRWPIAQDQARDFSSLLWRDLPGAVLPVHSGGQPFPSEAAQAIQRLSSVGHWVVPIDTPQGPVHLLTFHATPPVFDGPEDRNGLRNRDELRLWLTYLGGALGPVPDHFVVLGDANIDPDGGQGRKEVIHELLSGPHVSDPLPGRPTVRWQGVGDLRVDYALPARALRVTGAGVLWPAEDDPFAATVEQASRHRLVWVDVALP